MWRLDVSRWSLSIRLTGALFAGYCESQPKDGVPQHVETLDPVDRRAKGSPLKRRPLAQIGVGYRRPSTRLSIKVEGLMSVLVSQPSRWTAGDVARFYDDHRVLLARRRGLVFTSLSFVVLTICSPRLYFSWLALITAAEWFVDYAARSPLRSRKRYEALCAFWSEILDDSSSSAVMVPAIALKDGERVIYMDNSSRYLERHLGARSSGAARINTKSSRGSATGPHSTVEQIYGNVPVDEGQLIITDRRVVFLGKRDTIEIASLTIFRYSWLQTPDRLIFEYTGRPPGESYTIEKLFFDLCIYCRSKTPVGPTPIPPAPLPVDTYIERLRPTGRELPEAAL
jgi:hypothetical protein